MVFRATEYWTAFFLILAPQKPPNKPLCYDTDILPKQKVQRLHKQEVTQNTLTGLIFFP